MAELELNKTVIGTVTVKNKNNEPVTYKILYGNFATPKVNGFSMHLSHDRYKNMLTEFLRSADGEDYDPPSDEELDRQKRAVEKDLELQKIAVEAEAKKKQEAQAKAEEEKKAKEAAIAREQQQSASTHGSTNHEASNTDLQASNDDIKRLQVSINALTTQMNSMGETVANILVNTSNTEKNESLEDDAESVEKASNNKPIIILVAVALLFTIVNLAVSGITLLKYSNASANATVTENTNKDQTEKTSNTLVIDGQTYTIESTPMELADGQTKVSMYAITTTNEGGKNVNKVIPLGDINIADIEKAVKDATSQKADDTSKDTNADDTSDDVEKTGE